MSNAKHDVTIILPVVKTEFLESCIKSLESSTDVDNLKIELLIINVGKLDLSGFCDSSQLTCVILDRFGADYKSAVIYGISKSNSDLIALMNDDDVVHPMRLSRQFEMLSGGETDVAITGMKAFGQNQKTFSINLLPKSHFHYRYLWLGPYGANATWMFQKSWFERHIGSSLEGSNFDWKFSLIAFKTSSIKYDFEPLYFYRQHENQLTKESNYRNSLATDMMDFLVDDIRVQFQFTPTKSVVKALAFPYLQNKVSSQTLFDLSKISIKLLFSKETFSIWLIYHLVLRFGCACYWWTKGEH